MAVPYWLSNVEVILTVTMYKFRYNLSFSISFYFIDTGRPFFGLQKKSSLMTMAFIKDTIFSSTVMIVI